MRHNLETMRAMGADVRRVVAVGGGTRGELWPRIVSDVCGVAQELPERTLGAALGDCLLAGMAAGLLAPDAPGFNALREVIEPDAAPRPVYDELWGVYRRLYEAARDELHVLARAGQMPSSSPPSTSSS